MASTPPPPIPYGAGDLTPPVKPPTPGQLTPPVSGPSSKLVPPVKTTIEKTAGMIKPGGEPKSEYDVMEPAKSSVPGLLGKQLTGNATFEMKLIYHAPMGIANFFGGLVADVAHFVRHSQTGLGVPYPDEDLNNGEYAYNTSKELGKSLKRTGGLIYEPGRGWFVREGDYYRAFRAGQPVGGLLIEDIGNAAMIFGAVGGTLRAAGAGAGEAALKGASEAAAEAAAKVGTEEGAAAAQRAARLQKIGETQKMAGEKLVSVGEKFKQVEHKAGKALSLATIRPYTVVFTGGKIPFSQKTFGGLGQLYRNGAYLGSRYLAFGQKAFDATTAQIEELYKVEPNIEYSDPRLVDLRERANRYWRQANGWRAKQDMKHASNDSNSQGKILASKIANEIANAKYRDEINPDTGEAWGPLSPAEQEAVISIFTDHAQLIDALVKKGMPLRQVMVMGNYDWQPGYHLSENGAKLALQFLNGDTGMSPAQYERLAQASENMRAVSAEMTQTALKGTGRRQVLSPEYLIPTPILESLISRLKAARLTDHLEAIEFLREAGIWDLPLDSPVRADYLRQIVSSLPDDIALDSSMYPPTMRESIEYYRRVRRALNRDAIRAGIGERPLNPKSGEEGAAAKWAMRQEQIIRAYDALMEKRKEGLKRAEENHSKKMVVARTYELAEDYVNGATIDQLVKKYGMSASEINQILNRNELVRRWRESREAQKEYERVRRSSRKVGIGAADVPNQEAIALEAQTAKQVADEALAEYQRALVDFQRQQQQAQLELEQASVERDMAEMSFSDTEDDLVAAGGDTEKYYEMTPIVDETALAPDGPEGAVEPAAPSDYLGSVRSTAQTTQWGKSDAIDKIGYDVDFTSAKPRASTVDAVNIISEDLDRPIPYDTPYTTNNGDLPHLHAAAKQLVDWIKEVMAADKNQKMKLILNPPDYVDPQLAKRILRGMTRDEKLKTMKETDPNHPFKKFNNRVGLFLREFLRDIRLIDDYVRNYGEVTYVDWSKEKYTSSYGQPYDSIRGQATSSSQHRIYINAVKGDGSIPFITFNSTAPKEVVIDALDALAKSIENGDGAMELRIEKYSNTYPQNGGASINGLTKKMAKFKNDALKQIADIRAQILKAKSIDPKTIVETGKEDIIGHIKPHEVSGGGVTGPRLAPAPGGKLKPVEEAGGFPPEPAANAVMGDGYKINKSSTKAVLRELNDLLYDSELPVASWIEETKALDDPLSAPDVVLNEIANLDINPSLWGDSWSEIDSTTQKAIVEIRQLIANAKAEIARRKAAGITIEPTWAGKRVKAVVSAKDKAAFDKTFVELEKNPKVKRAPRWRGDKPLSDFTASIKVLRDAGYEPGKPFDFSYLDIETLDAMNEAITEIESYQREISKSSTISRSSLRVEIRKMTNALYDQLVDRQPLPELKTIERPPLNMLNRRADICIIPCGNEKMAVPAPAGEFYTGSMFRDALNTARQMFTDDRIYVMSAKHGLVPLDFVLEPYDLKMGQAGSITPDVVAKQLDAIVGSKSNVLSFLPKDYHGVLDLAASSSTELASRAVLEEAYAGTTGIGKQKAVLKNFREEAMKPLPKVQPINNQAVEYIAKQLSEDPEALAELDALVERKLWLEDQIEKMQNPSPEEVAQFRNERVQAAEENLNTMNGYAETMLEGTWDHTTNRVRFWVTPVKGMPEWEWWYRLGEDQRRNWARDYFKGSWLKNNSAFGPKYVRVAGSVDEAATLAGRGSGMTPDQWGEEFIRWATEADKARAELRAARNQNLTPEEVAAKDGDLIQAQNELDNLITENSLDDDVIAAVGRAHEIANGINVTMANHPNEVVPDMSIAEPAVRLTVYTQDMIDSLAADAAQKMEKAQTAVARLQALDEFIRAANNNVEGRKALGAALAKQNARWNAINIDTPEKIVKRREELKAIAEKRRTAKRRLNAVLKSEEYKMLQALPADLPLTVAMDPDVFHPSENLQFEVNGEMITPDGPMYLPTGGKASFAGGMRTAVVSEGTYGHERLRSEHRRAGDRQTIFNLREIALKASRDMRKIVTNEAWKALIFRFGKKASNFIPDERLAAIEEEARLFARNMPTMELQSYVSDIPLTEDWTPGIGAEAPGVRSPRAALNLAERRKFGELVELEMRNRGYVAVDPWGPVDALVSSHRINGDTMYLPAGVKESVAAVEQPAAVNRWQRAADSVGRVNSLFKVTTLATSIMWQLGDLWTNIVIPAMTGVTPKTMGRQMMEVYRNEYGSLRSLFDPRSEGTLTPKGVMEREAPVQDISISTALQRTLNPELGAGKQPGRIASSRVGRAIRFGVDVSFKINETINRLTRHAYHLSLLEEALTKIGKTIDEVADDGSWRSDPAIKKLWLDTAETANKWLGDFADLTIKERRYVSGLFPFWAWTKHIHKVFAALAVEHPESLAFYILMGQIGSDPNNIDDPNDPLGLRFGTLPVAGGIASVNFLNPIGDVVEGPIGKFLTEGGNLSGFGRMTGPVPRLLAGAIGYDVANMRPLRKPASRQMYSKTGTVQGGLINPSNIGQSLSQTAGFALQQFPAGTRILNLLPGKTIPGTEIAVGPVSRYSTGEARTSPLTGERIEQPGGRLAALGRTFSIPFIPSRSDQQIQDVYNSAVGRLKTVNKLTGKKNTGNLP